ncbi:hypothetical protein [Actinoplanes sp. NBRC 101535]|uniref:hypothetical protein n=2 Tax=Actinoplanes TaxID=1865 RepID=UPI0025523E3B|nr:hypothetical protein [Actinoplanes sp. NBRC 101535]
MTGELTHTSSPTLMLSAVIGFSPEASTLVYSVLASSLSAPNLIMLVPVKAAVGPATCGVNSAAKVTRALPASCRRSPTEARRLWMLSMELP